MKPSGIPFHKAHGLGNDFVVVDSNSLPSAPDAALQELSHRICDRHRGVGADGVVVLYPGTDYPQTDFSIRLFNSDGSEAEMSGNGIRCAAAVHHFNAPGASQEVVIGSVAGRRTLRMKERIQNVFIYSADMGIPEFKAESIPFKTEGLPQSVRPVEGCDVVSVPVSVEDRTFDLTAMWVGNPQCITIVESFDSLDWKRYGRALESHIRFPNKANVEFVRVLDEHTLEIRIWERGAGHTESSGTGSMASAIGAILNGRAKSPICVRTEGGELLIEWEGQNHAVFLTGEAEVVAKGTFCG
ncbi:MAG: diaminopimelate epimerase [Acidobacteriia bacterium]|nr:diaminopimelate epimerase [Terriglobia bacterium]